MPLELMRLNYDSFVARLNAFSSGRQIKASDAEVNLMLYLSFNGFIMIVDYDAISGTVPCLGEARNSESRRDLLLSKQKIKSA
jgi:hypothetical protein